MKSTIIENTDVEVSRLGFGTASLHHHFSSGQRQQLLYAAASAGITHFDTSPYYGYGRAESDLGVFLSRQRDAFTVTTKVGLYPWHGPSRLSSAVWMRKALGKFVPKISAPVANWQLSCARSNLYQSLRRLGSEYVDFLLLHEPDPALMETEEFLRWVESEQAAGRIRAWGVAGVLDLVKPFVVAKHPLANVVQTRDSLDKQQANFMKTYGRNFQFTYGYISSNQPLQNDYVAATIVRSALQRNSTGTVLFSSRRAERIVALVNEVI